MMSSGSMPYFSVSSFTERCGDGQFALAREGLRLQFIFVDGADDQRRAVGLRDRADRVRTFLRRLRG